MSNNAAEQAPEKSKFARKCNLLSRYLKQKGSFGDINIGLTRKPGSSLGFAGELHPSGQPNGMAKSEPSETKSFDFIQKLSLVSKIEESDLREPASVPEPATSQLTIFFAGKVIVFNEFRADKAKEILEIAKQANPGTLPNAAFGSEFAAEESCKNNNNNIISCSSSKNELVIPDLNEPTSSGNTNNHQTRQQNQIVERIARRASLHRFFAKRKDRAVARAPYQVNQNADRPPKPEAASPMSLERGQSSRQANNGLVVAAAPLLMIPEGLKEKPLEEEKEGGQCLKDLELRL